MHRIDSSTAVPALPVPTAVGTPGYFTAGDLTKGKFPTTLTPEWGNSVQEEIANVIEYCDFTLDKTNNGQLLQAILQIAEGTVSIGSASTTVAGTVKLSTHADLVAGTDDTKASTPASVALAAQSGCWSFADDTGTDGNALVVTLAPAPGALVDGMTVLVRTAQPNTGAVTLNVNDLGAQPVKAQGLALTAGQLAAGQTYAFAYNAGAAAFEAVSPVRSNAAGVHSNLSGSGPWWKWDPADGELRMWGLYTAQITSEGDYTIEFPVIADSVQVPLASTYDPANSNSGNTTFPVVSFSTTSFVVRAQDDVGGSAAAAGGITWIAQGICANPPQVNPNVSSGTGPSGGGSGSSGGVGGGTGGSGSISL